MERVFMASKSKNDARFYSSSPSIASQLTSISYKGREQIKYR